MMNKPAPKRIVLIVSIIICLIFLSIISFYFVFGPEENVNQNIPSSFLYTQKKETVPDEYRQMFVTSADESTPEVISLSEGVLIDENGKTYCLPEGSPAEKVEYYSYSPGFLVIGGWYYRYALICGERYYIVDGTDSVGITLYGSFKTPYYSTK